MNAGDEKAKEIHFLELLSIPVRARWKIVRNTVLTVIIVLLISLILPRKYVAVSTLMPPQERDQSAMTSVLADMTVPGFALPGQVSAAEILVEILKSRTVGERVLERSFAFGDEKKALYRGLGYASAARGVAHLPEFTRFLAGKQGVITIRVELGRAGLAAAVANAFVEELDRVNQEKSVSRAKNSRLYIESQLRETETELDRANRELAGFKQEHKTVSLEDQMRVSIQQAGELKGQIIAKQIEIGMMLQTKKPENPMVIRAQNELDELWAQYYKLQYGGSAPEEDQGDFYMPFVDVPKVGLQLADLTREVKVQETVWEWLNQQYYQAKIEEARDTPTVQVLDRAVPPSLPSSPQPKRLALIFGLLGFVLSLVWAFGEDALRRLDRRPEEREKLQALANEFRGDRQRFSTLLKEIRERLRKKE